MARIKRKIVHDNDECESLSIEESRHKVMMDALSQVASSINDIKDVVLDILELIDNNNEGKIVEDDDQDEVDQEIIDEDYKTGDEIDDINNYDSCVSGISSSESFPSTEALPSSTNVNISSVSSISSPENLTTSTTN